MTSFFGTYGAGLSTDARGTNATDSGSHFYDVYQCADGKFVSLAPIEAKFHAELLRRLEIDPASVPAQWDKTGWPRMKALLAERFRTRTRDEWSALLEGTDACFAPVLSPAEAPGHPHIAARGTFIEVDGVVQPAPAPRFSRSVPETPKPPRPADAEAAEAILAPWLDAEEIAAARSAGTIAS
jgi:alpha-methylacyl-CoA racemase